MKRFFVLSIPIIVLLCVALTCLKNTKKCHSGLTVMNNSSKDIYFRLGSDDCNGTNFSMHNCFGAESTVNVKVGETDEDWIRGGCLEKANFPIKIYIFDATDIETLPWRQVWPIDTIYPTLEELQSNNWTVVYTGE